MKTGLGWYKRKPTAFLGGVQGLTAPEIAVYAVVIELIYQHGGAIHNDPKWISGWIKDMGSSAARNTISALVARGKLFTTDAGEIHNKPAENELKTTENLSETRAEVGRKGGINSGKSRNESKEINAVAEANREADKIREDKRRKEEPPISPVATLPARKRALCVSSEFDGEFEKVWPHYPRHVGVAKARLAWRKARGRASFEEIASTLRGAIRAWKSTPVDKVPHFSSWLNRDGWLDEPEHAANRPRTSAEDLAHLSTITATEDLARLFPAPQLRMISQ